jgi:hypothetical protein
MPFFCLDAKESKNQEFINSIRMLIYWLMPLNFCLIASNSEHYRLFEGEQINGT